MEVPDMLMLFELFTPEWLAPRHRTCKTGNQTDFYLDVTKSCWHRCGGYGMSLLTVIIIVAAVIFALFLISLASKLPGADPWIIRAAQIAVIVIAVIFVCRGLGLFDLLARVRI